jgi:hemerythrin-like domain-containing protein
MSRPIGITAPGSAPGPGFDEPFEMLQACHERVGRMLALLQKLRSRMRTRAPDDQGHEQMRQAARDVMRYFDVAAPQHHRDEELHVFPTLLGLQDAELVALVARLQQDHVQMEARWKPARSLLEEVAEGARTSFNDADDAILDAFANLYEGHIEAEESMAFPRAASTMEPERLEAMSRDMAQRRGVKPSGSQSAPVAS